MLQGYVPGKHRQHSCAPGMRYCFQVAKLQRERYRCFDMHSERWSSYCAKFHGEEKPMYWHLAQQIYTEDVRLWFSETASVHSSQTAVYLLCCRFDNASMLGRYLTYITMIFLLIDPKMQYFSWHFFRSRCHSKHLDVKLWSWCRIPHPKMIWKGFGVYIKWYIHLFFLCTCVCGCQCVLNSRADPCELSASVLLRLRSIMIYCTLYSIQNRWVCDIVRLVIHKICDLLHFKS